MVSFQVTGAIYGRCDYSTPRRVNSVRSLYVFFRMSGVRFISVFVWPSIFSFIGYISGSSHEYAISEKYRDLGLGYLYSGVLALV